MPRKPKREKTTITVVMNGVPITVSLHPPTGRKKTWYAYWTGLTFNRSTGCRDLKGAVVAAENMVRNGGRHGVVADTVLSDDKFFDIQIRHFGKKKSPDAKKRAAKSLTHCLNALEAFKAISELPAIALATPDDCERFQEVALTKPKNWRKQYPKSKTEGVANIRPNTVLAYSRSLQAAFNRVNVNAGRKCVRAKIDERKLLQSNPWQQFTWIDGTDPINRRFNSGELLSLIDYLELNWPAVTCATLFAKISFWTWARRTEVSHFKWSDFRIIGSEYHVDFIGKWGVRKWARLPAKLYCELLELRFDSPYIFAAYNDQLRGHHLSSSRPRSAKLVGGIFSPNALCEWFNDRLDDWTKANSLRHASHHSLRKTALQYARQGEDRNRINDQVALDAKITTSVMMRHYVDERDEELRHSSNRTFSRIAAGLSLDVAKRYGYELDGTSELEHRLREAVGAADWTAVKNLADQLLEETS